MRVTEQTDAQIKRAYAAKLESIAKRYDRLDHETIKAMVSLLQQLRKDISAVLLEDPSAFETWRLTELKANIEQQITRFQSQLSGVVRGSFRQGAEVGVDLLDEPLIVAGYSLPFNRLDPAVVNVVTDFSAMLVQNIGDDLRSQIDKQLRLAALAQKTPFQTMKGITDAMGIKSYDGVWGVRNRPDVVRGVAARAEAIVRTELTRVSNLAHYSRQQQTAQVVEGLQKAWVATGDSRTRPSHLRAHLETHRQPIPVDKPFDVGGFKLMYPGDPKAPAQETINCRCRSKTIVPAIGVIETPQDILIREEAERRK